MKLEICANSYQSAINAEKGGADRIELCEELSVGGITPSHLLIQEVIKALNIPVFVLIRPRQGDFVYSAVEFNQIKSDIEFCKSVGCHGIVSGILNPNNTIDIKRTSEIIEWSKPLPFTFHRAFDAIINPKKALQQLADIGCHRVLTSGQKTKAIEGLPLLKELKELSKNKLTILVGGNVRSTNAMQFKTDGFKEIHSSAIINEKYSDLAEIKRLVLITKG